MENLIKDAYDLHMHTGPDVVPRKANDYEVAQKAAEYGMRGFVIKAHYSNTGPRAGIMRSLFPALKVIGALALNNAMGALNPIAVELGARDGIKILWFPTMDAQNMKEYYIRNGAPIPAGCAYQDARLIEGLTILDEKGKMKPVVYDIIDLVVKHDLVLCTGHLSPHEATLLLTAARERGVKRLIATHPEFPPTAATMEEQKEYVRLGAKVEHNLLNIIENIITPADFAKQIRWVGVENVIISSDLGQAKNPHPTEGFNELLHKLIPEGITPDEIRTMIVKNTRELVE